MQQHSGGYVYSQTARAMSDLAEDESGGGVMIVFTSDPEKQWEVFEAIRYTTKALRAQQLIVVEHEADSKKKQPR